jgi:hypothetical protein
MNDNLQNCSLRLVNTNNSGFDFLYWIPMSSSQVSCMSWLKDPKSNSYTVSPRARLNANRGLIFRVKLRL